MGIFDEKSHIKKTEDLKKAVKHLRLVSDKDKKEVVKMFKSSIMKPSGLSKKEFEKELKSAYKDPDNKIGKDDINRFKKAA
ncbi:hypothetical protein A3H65_03735 [Candidatus Giovannonibacteria bacterium RIFCSPLOWO2_02_FULL_45_14]|uniref:EF-hand domain-containing protein n=1 Tax=Candidatus Giovannonibacteria bacterium RIFCSPLOWO2_12_FULL_44_15 TaxID=1798364 RepID=A0A1F5XZB2_9BACT|nr:MAG: hypothetical protein A3C75_00735 [Candidatus Giovannonibacteria bacterium RIFCSPHIGHO2_02_FULL_44_31]OGF76352.1 MAG: hypothetical protein A3E62_02335 [Candidatus Giovannonibacteria bacterium RIFCSPHIGHO2_12_FULL_44_29]OGF90572.1 MAG: hypothetical protein A3H65_03735 [Candidatus Giovannonibacteria bacterium RIFCSPLOWO2_02_FULL_45_14]OGF93170.1 MAG: hypothetical protein A3G54_00220 [Candidatus Giovannonibacteria bacterium RIFCSPLOWO2_12_FULL_44_15]